MTGSRFWWDHSTADFAAGDLADTVVVFPLAAFVQHGPHLPVRVDAAIGAGLLATAHKLPSKR